MGRDRLAAFSDGVIAILITIMVLELKVPHGADWAALAGIAAACSLSYVLSFVYVAIYWNNHHHLLHTVVRVDGSILWANSHLLFWLSLDRRCDGLDGTKPLVAAADRGLWRRIADVGHRLLPPAAGNHPQTGDRSPYLPKRSAATLKARSRRYFMSPELCSRLSAPGYPSGFTDWSRSCGSFPTGALRTLSAASRRASA